MAHFGRDNRWNNPSYGLHHNEYFGSQIGAPGNRIHRTVQQIPMGFMSRGRASYRGDPRYHVSPRDRDGARHAAVARDNRRHIANLFTGPPQDFRRPYIPSVYSAYRSRGPREHGRDLGYPLESQLYRPYAGLESPNRRPPYTHDDAYSIRRRSPFRRSPFSDFCDDEYFRNCDPDLEDGYSEDDDDSYYGEDLYSLMQRYL